MQIIGPFGRQMDRQQFRNRCISVLPTLLLTSAAPHAFSLLEPAYVSLFALLTDVQFQSVFFFQSPAFKYSGGSKVYLSWLLVKPNSYVSFQMFNMCIFMLVVIGVSLYVLNNSGEWHIICGYINEIIST